MKTAALPIFPNSTTSAAKVMLACLGVYWVCMLTFSFGETRSADVAIKVLLGVACCFLVLTTSFHAAALGDAVRVLHAQRAPAVLWRTWLHTWLATSTRYWAVICLGVSLQLAMPASTTFWLAGPALLSLALCQAALRTMGQLGMVPRVWRHAAELSAFGIVIYAGLVTGFGPALAWFAGLPAVLLFAFALAWPAMAWTIATSHGGKLPAGAPARRRAAVKPHLRVLAFFKRYTLLHWSEDNLHAAGDGSSPFDKLRLLAGGEIVFYVLTLQLIPMQWGGTATPVRVVGMFFLCMITAGKLVVRDLHWRMLLLPGGLQRKRIGTHILLSTLTFQMAAHLLIALAYLAFKLAAGSALTDALLRLLEAAALPFELAFITSAAVLVRPLSRPIRIALGCLALAAGLGGLYAMTFATPGALLAGGGSHPVPLYDLLSWRVGAAYVLLLAAFTFIMTHVANRLWTPEKLLRQMPRKGRA